METDASGRDYARQAFQTLRFGFTVAPIVFGLDKSFDLLVDWDKYLAPWIARMVGSGHGFMLLGVVEIVAGLVVAWRPRWGSYLVAFWLLDIIVNLVTLRDFGLLLGAVALGRLSAQYNAA